MDGGQRHYAAYDLGHVGGNAEEGIPPVSVNLIHAGGKPGEILPRILGVVFLVAPLQQRGGHIPPHLAVHSPGGAGT